MWEKFKQYWQKGFGSKTVIVLLVAILIFLVVSIVGGYTGSYYFSWVGIGDYYPPSGLKTDAERGKTLWDWMELLIIPLVLFLGGYWLNKTERDREARRKEEREAEAADQIKENEWQNYLDRMTDLLERGLRETDINSPLQDIARVRTLTTLRRLDGSRKGMLLLFLFDASLITSIPSPVVNLLNADFTEADLHGAVLTAMVYQKEDKPKGIYRRGISQEEAKLMGLDLSQTLKIEADLSDVLPGFSMRGAVLIKVNLSNADLSKALLIGANLSDAILISTDLRETVLTGANLSGAKLSQAKLNGAILYQANLSGAKLSGAKYDDLTKWPEGFNPEEAGAIKAKDKLL